MNQPLNLLITEKIESCLPSPPLSPSPASDPEGRLFRHLTPESIEDSIDGSNDDSADASDDSKTNRKCNYCGATSTPMYNSFIRWRHGPGDYTNLCNSCGVKWRRGKILHSGGNRHHLCKQLSPKPKKTKEVKFKDVDNVAPPARLHKRKAQTSIDKSVLKVSKIAPSPVKQAEKAITVKVVAYSNLKTLSPSSHLIPPTDHPIIPSITSTTITYPESIDQLFAPDSLISVQKSIIPVILSIERLPQTPSKAQSTSSLMDVLTDEFADLLDILTPERTPKFVSLLAKCFEPKVALAYKLGKHIEMNVLDITQETWDSLRALVQQSQSLAL